MSEYLDLDAIKARCDAATPGPWARDTAKWDEEDLSSPELVTRHDGDPSVRNPLYARNVVRCYPGDADMDTASGQEAKDATFIAHARTDVPALVAEVERLRRLLDIYRDRALAMQVNLDVHVRFRRFDGSSWEFGRLVGKAFVNPNDPEGARWVTVEPALAERGGPTTLTVPITADRLRTVDDDYRTYEEQTS